MDEQQPIRVVVEIATPEVIKRLEGENEALRQELKLTKAQFGKLHETVYQLMSRFSELRRSVKDK